MLQTDNQRSHSSSASRCAAGFLNQDVSLTERLSLRLILRRMRQWPFVLEHLAKITAVNPAIAGWAPDEMVGHVLRGIAKEACRCTGRAGSPSAKLLHHDSIALDFVQIKLDRRGRLG